MTESYTICPICRRRVDAEQPDAVLTEKSDNVPGFGQEHDVIWSRVGFAHEACLVGARGFRPAVEQT